MAALALPVALVLGMLSELAAGLARRVFRGERGWWRGVTGRGGDLRRLLRSGRARPAVAESAGAVAALAGAGLAAGASLGLIPGSMALVYPGLALGAVGGHLASPIRGGVEGAAAWARLQAMLVEPAFVLALGAMVLRWRAVDLEAIRGTQTVLGPGIALRPTGAAVGLGLAALAAVLAGAIRLPPDDPGPGPRRGAQARRAGASLLAAISRWTVGGATAVVVAAMVAGHRLDASPELLAFAGAAAAASIVLGVAGGVIRRLGRRGRLTVAAGALVAAVAGAVLVLAA